MSTLNVNSIKDTSGGDDNLTILGKNTCKAWINFNGTGTVTIRDSYNIDSIIDNGTGDYTINLTTDFTTTDYCILVSNDQYMDRSDYH